MSGNGEQVFGTATLTTSGRPVLLPDEAESHLLSNVSLEWDTKSTDIHPPQRAHLILTSHRLLLLPPDSSSSAISIPLATIAILPPKKTLKSMIVPHRFKFQVSSLLSIVAATAAVRSRGDVSGFLAKFSENVKRKYWETDNAEGNGSGHGLSGLYSSDGSVRMVGVAGILRKEQEIWETTDKSLQEAFQDLNALMVT